MKRLKYLIAVLAFASFGTQPIFSENVELIIANTAVGAGPSLQFEVWMKTTGVVSLGTSNIIVTYNTAAFGTNTIAKFTPANFSDGNYQPINVTNLHPDTKSINIELNNAGTGTPVGTTGYGTKVGTFVFTQVLDPAQATGIQFDLNVSEFFADDEDSKLTKSAGANDAAGANFVIPPVEVLIINSGMEAGPKFRFEVWLKTAGALALGTSNIMISYNPLAFGTYTEATFVPENFSGTAYQTTGFTQISDGAMSINIDLNTAGTGTPIGRTQSGIKVGTFTFTSILDPTKANGIHVDVVNTVLYADDETSVLTATAGINDAADIPLPVELASFSGEAKARSVVLTWKTATERNNAGFEVQRKQGEGAWAKIGYVAGNGSSSAEHTYSLKDVVSLAAKYLYRLKQIDRNGAFTYSDEIEVATVLASEDYALSTNYPNPFNPATKFTFAVKAKGQVAVKVFNTIGQEVATLFDGVAVADKIYEMSFNGSGFASGPYFYMLKTSDRHEIKKMILLK